MATATGQVGGGQSNYNSYDQSNSGAYGDQSASANKNSQSSSSSSGSQSSSATADSVRNTSADQLSEALTDSSQYAQNVTANSASKQSSASNQSSADNSLTSVSDISRNQTELLDQQDSWDRSSSRSTALVFNDLARLNSRHLVLRVDMRADEMNETISLFSGRDNFARRTRTS